MEGLIGTVSRRALRRQDKAEVIKGWLRPLMAFLTSARVIFLFLEPFFWLLGMRRWQKHVFLPKLDAFLWSG